MIKMPYTNLHELNLDWIIEQIGKDGPVRSVNEKTGIVTLTAEDIKRTASGPQTVEYALSTQGNSIQETRTQIGVVPLPTIAQTITGAIAENSQDIADIDDKMGDTEITAGDHTVTGAISEHESEINTINDKIAVSSIITSGIVSPEPGIDITSQQAVVTDNMITLRIVCKKTDGTAFTGRTSPAFTIMDSYKPKMAISVPCITCQTPGSFMTGYALAYTNIVGSTLIDIPTGITDQKEITYCTTYLRG